MTFTENTNTSGLMGWKEVSLGHPMSQTRLAETKIASTYGLMPVLMTANVL